MSWISENYEKAAVGVATVALLGLTFMGWHRLNSVEEDFSDEPAGSGQNDPAVPAADEVSTARSSFQLKHEWTKGDYEGRPVDLFTGVPLFVNKNNQVDPVDLPTSPPVHPPVPNQWWIDNRIDPGFGDSPQRDADEDGFSNVEEFTAQTDPNDPREFPSLIGKLGYVGDEAVEWVLRPGFEAQGGFTFDYSDSLRRKARVSAANVVMPGETFFGEGPMENRFKLLGSERRKQANEAIGAEVDVTIVRVEDQKPNKKGIVYEIPSMFRKKDARQFSNHDRTAILSLAALGMEGQEFKVEERSSFSLPPDGKEKVYMLKEITPEKITVEHTAQGGESKTYEILIGSVGPVAP